MKSNALGVVVVRLQVPELHGGHRYLLNSVTAIHKRVLVVIGETEARLTAKDPLTFEMRVEMLKASFPNVVVDRLPDHPSDEEWSLSLDHLIEGYDSVEPVLYGGRDSFLQHYRGRFRTFELPPTEPVSGTEIRSGVQPENSAAFRRGVIWASKYRYATSYQAVDAAVVRPGRNGKVTEVLLGRKERDGDKWRFIGGFVTPDDVSLEGAVAREVREETGVEPGEPQYLGSIRINDFRYRGSGDQILSALFLVPLVFGAGQAADDIAECRWFDVFNITEDHFVPEHRPLYRLLITSERSLA